MNRLAALKLRRGGAIVSVLGSEAIPPALADELRARDITVNGVVAGTESPGSSLDPHM